ncbi:glycosyl transferase family 2 [Litoreibacter meonggei]|uniref:Glycosyl transferase family 2 n=2 Tax=Litoreibacter meonggei TaxID=1049199 RepID=A0A497VLI4_9RHOB|nr:glycosyltransferase family 2 protein [Litoreibacter meonggei]RLJ41538.1 glycosyl transferase family 2 [Litoreibacter meonggei]
MAQTDIYQKRELNTVEDRGIVALDCIGWENPVGGMWLRVFFKSGTACDLFDPKPREGCATFSELRTINGAPLLAGMSEVSSDHIQIALKEGQLTLPVQRPETDLFEDMNVCMLERNGEPIEVVEEWMRYHVTGHGLNAVLMLDREKPNNEKGFEKKLKVLAAKIGLKRLVHVKSAVPLGAEDLPPASHPFNAPDAPGKDRMDNLPVDPQTSPLAELSLYEWAKWRFLSRARAVMNIDLMDLLALEAQPFKAVHDSSVGVIQLVGQRVYPWRVRPKKQPKFGDHICRQFDNPRANRRWCLAPSRVGRDKVWRFVRVVDAEPQPDETMGFLRAMAIRHPKHNAAELVPKTSLIEDEYLLAMAQDIWDHKPVRPPESKMEEPAGKAIDGGRTVIVTCMKNEGPFILEWIAFHRAIGVDDFLVYTNDCDDGTDELLDLLQERGIVQRRDNKFAGTDLKPQHWALDAADGEDVFKNAGWAISMDVDEFINIHVGDGKLDDLYKAVGDANMISLTWRLFGNADIHEYKDEFLISQFTECAPELCRKPHQAWGFKTLFRNIGIYKKMGVHRPKGLKPDLWDKIKWVNGSGQPMPKKLIRNGWRSTTDSYGYDLVTLNHYAVRSAESFLVKRDRGRVNHVDRDQGLSYWFRMNNNWEENASAQTKLPLLQAEFDRLMADPELRAAHEYSVAKHREKIEELKATENYSNFYNDLTGPRMERLSRMHNYFGANVFLAGPDVIPDEVALKDDIPEDFFFTVEKVKTTH